MVQVNSIIDPSALNDVLHGLEEEGIQGVTVTRVLGKGCWDGTETELTEKVMVIVIVPNKIYKDKAMEAIRANAQDIDHGAGKIWVVPVLEVERIRTGERDLDALEKTIVKNKKRSNDIDLDAFSAIDTPAS
ncbi:P-II family nitrogen regulator [Sulfurimonas sp. SWIR-19]|uniref:P-II family nitrogen regulator n=1 Tax=Sulfurimonas sp. SWIR-19 TaxID=2878390 RepID=UPI001CF5E4A9|nr:P-II family nitrogen regulator [Sulfurimonas sp. SWIR-19]UCN00758.1 P-II family nitrogen regulator [Sulfurimonas sp. SWIR-19]